MDESVCRSEAAKKKRTMNRLQEMTRVKPVESKAGGKKPRDAEDSEEDLFNSEVSAAAAVLMAHSLENVWCVE